MKEYLIIVAQVLMSKRISIHVLASHCWACIVHASGPLGRAEA